MARLPTKLLERIFILVLQTENQSRSNVLSSIDSHWRSTALNLPSIWSRFECFANSGYPRLSLADLWLTRSQTHPLSICFTTSEVTHKSTRRPLSATEMINFCQRLLRLLLPHQSRWKTFKLEVESYREVLVPFRSISFSGALQLEELSLRLGGSDEMPMLAALATIPPQARLRRLDWTSEASHRIPLVPPVIPCAEDLSYVRFSWNRPWEHIILSLLQCKSVTTAKLETPLGLGQVSRFLRQGIRLDTLRVLHISSENRVVLTLFSFLQAPELIVMSIKISGDTGTERLAAAYSRLVGFLATAGSQRPCHRIAMFKLWIDGVAPASGVLPALLKSCWAACMYAVEVVIDEDDWDPSERILVQRALSSVEGGPGVEGFRAVKDQGRIQVGWFSPSGTSEFLDRVDMEVLNLDLGGFLPNPALGPREVPFTHHLCSSTAGVF